MITTQLHFLNAENKIPPQPRYKTKNSVELIQLKQPLGFALLWLGD